MAAPIHVPTCEAIAEEAPDLFDAFGEERVLAICEEIQNSEIHEQSALFQEMFRTFNLQYFAGRLPEYKIRVVYDVYYWEIEHCGQPPRPPREQDLLGWIDFDHRRIFIAFHPSLPGGYKMPGILLHEMAHAATDGHHDQNWKGEISRLKLLGAPMNEGEFEKSSLKMENFKSDEEGRSEARGSLAETGIS